MRYSGFLRKDEGNSVQSWADITDEGELILDWNDVVFYSHKFDRGFRNYESALGKMISIIQRRAYEHGFQEGLQRQEWSALWMAQAEGNA